MAKTCDCVLVQGGMNVRSFYGSRAAMKSKMFADHFPMLLCNGHSLLFITDASKHTVRLAAVFLPHFLTDVREYAIQKEKLLIITTVG